MMGDIAAAAAGDEDLGSDGLGSVEEDDAERS
jgi:hypothetical protein